MAADCQWVVLYNVQRLCYDVRLLPPSLIRKRKQMKRHLLILPVIFAALFLAACAPEVNLLDETKLTDTSLLTDEPCEMPCWNDIIPGETSFRDAKLIIDGDERFKIVEEPDPKEDDPSRIFSFAQGENPACCQVSSRDGETVSLFLLQMAPELTYGRVFDRIGEPDYVTGQAVSDAQAYAALVYTDIPLVLYAYVAGALEGELSVSSEIIGAMYLAESEMLQLLDCTGLFDWQGFVPLSYYSGEEYDYVGEGVGNEAICPTG